MNRDENDTELDNVLEICRSNPEKSFKICNIFLETHPESTKAYFLRHCVYESMGKYQEALDDCEKMLEIDQSNMGHYFFRGEILRRLGDFQAAIHDFDMAFKLDVDNWYGSLGRLFRADCHARLGNREQALADCATLSEDHWTPGMFGLPRGNRAEVIAEIERLLSAAQRTPEKH